MASALLECINTELAVQLSDFIRNASARAGVDFDTTYFGKYIGVSYKGSYAYVYSFFMELVSYYPGSLAFIVINEKKGFPDDDYKLMILEDMPYHKSMRNSTEQNYWGRLCKDFLKAISRSQLTYQECCHIISHCVLGPVGEDDIGMCAMDFNTLANGNIAMMNTEMLLDCSVNYNNPTYGFPMQIRAMAHICYKRLRKFRR